MWLSALFICGAEVDWFRLTKGYAAPQPEKFRKAMPASAKRVRKQKKNELDAILIARLPICAVECVEARCGPHPLWSARYLSAEVPCTDLNWREK